MFKIADTIVYELRGGSKNNIIYYDFREISYLSNNDMYNLLLHIKELLFQKKDSRLVNVNSKIKKSITLLGLDKVIVCL